MHKLTDAEITGTADPEPADEYQPSEEQEAWIRDLNYARFGLQDGIFEQYRGYIIAIYEQKVVGKGKNPLHLSRRIEKKLGIDGLRMILVDPEYGIL